MIQRIAGGIGIAILLTGVAVAQTPATGAQISDAGANRS